MTVATSASTEPEKQSSTLLAEMERLSGQDVALKRDCSITGINISVSWPKASLPSTGVGRCLK